MNMYKNGTDGHGMVRDTMADGGSAFVGDGGTTFLDGNQET